jgi:hypothetical protein
MKFITCILIILSGSLLTSIITFSILLAINKQKINICDDQLMNCKFDSTPDNYILYDNNIVSNEFDLTDDSNQIIVIYSKDVKMCYYTCNKLYNCHGFNLYNNYCYFKKKFILSDIQPSETNKVYEKKEKET